MAAVKEGIDVAKAAIEAANAGLDLYDKVLDRVIPWKKFENITAELDKYRDDYSQESADLIGLVKQHMMDSQDSYFMATQSIYQWCGLVTPLLKAYLQLFKDNSLQKNAAQRTLLLKVLDDGIEKMNKAQNDLDLSSRSFNLAAGNLTSLYTRLQLESDEKSDYFQSSLKKLRLQVYGGAAFAGILGLAIAAAVLEIRIIPDLKAKLNEVTEFYKTLQQKVKDALDNIDDTKEKLREEIKIIGDLRVKTESTKEFILMDNMESLKEIITDAVNDLIENAYAYRKRHQW